MSGRGYLTDGIEEKIGKFRSLRYCLTQSNYAIAGYVSTPTRQFKSVFNFGHFHC